MADQNPESNPPKPVNELPDQLPKDLRVAVSAGDAVNPLNLMSGEAAKGPQKERGSMAKRLMVIGGAIFVVLLLAGTAYFLLGKANFSLNRGTLKLALEPAGVDIVIDGRFKRQSVNSLSIKLKAGEHVLAATKEGYLDWEQEFNLASGETKELALKLEPIPNIEALIESSVSFPEIVRSGKAMAYMNADGRFAMMDLTDKTAAKLFGDQAIAAVRSINWAPGEPTALAKLNGTPELINLYDNRGVRGRFVRLGERPTQGAPRDIGISSWLFDDARHTATGWQPVLLNESIGDFDFSPDGSRMIYFYHTADGEKSLIVAHPDGGDWERLATQVEANNPSLIWLNTDRYVLVVDDQNNAPDRVFDLVSKNLIEIMPDRMANTLVASSPDGTRILYISEETGRKLAIWNLLNGSREKLFEGEIGTQTQFVWQTDNKFILNKDNGSLWYWDINGREKPVQFVSALGALQPIKLLYSIVNRQLVVVEQARILSLKV